MLRLQQSIRQKLRVEAGGGWLANVIVRARKHHKSDNYWQLWATWNIAPFIVCLSFVSIKKGKKQQQTTPTHLCTRSVLRPLLFSIFTTPSEAWHQVSVTHSTRLQMTHKLSSCVDAVTQRWRIRNNLPVNVIILCWRDGITWTTCLWTLTRQMLYHPVLTRWHIRNSLPLNANKAKAIFTGTRQEVAKFEKSSWIWMSGVTSATSTRFVVRRAHQSTSEVLFVLAVTTRDCPTATPYFMDFLIPPSIAFSVCRWHWFVSCAQRHTDQLRLTYDSHDTGCPLENA